MSDSLPERASVVVIGGGAMGCSTLYHLAEMGVGDAILVERNRLGSGTTWHSAAQVRALRSSRNMTRMIRHSVDLYARLEEETGQSVGWIQKGSLSIATSPDRLVHILRQEALARAYGVRAESIAAQEAKERWPPMRADDVIGAVWSPDDGRVSPSDLCAALAKGARMRGARLFENAGVTGILVERGRVRGVETARGTVMCDAVALCAGLWSREVGEMAGADVPVLACEHFYLLTKPVEGVAGNMPTLSDHDGRLYIRDDGGGLLVGCFEPEGKPIAPGALDASFEFGLLPEDWEHFEPMMANALHRLPVLETAQVRTLLNGPESFTPDGTFMLGETAETCGLFLGCGMNSVGIASGGGAGMNLAHLIAHGRTAYDLSEVDAKRFAPEFRSVEHLMARAPEVLGRHYEIGYPGRQPCTARDLRLLPLDPEHRRAGAHFGQFGGWERPLFFGAEREPVLRFGRPDWFENVRSEVMAAHRGAALFDASSFGKIDVRGRGAEALLLRVCSGRVGRAPGLATYTAMLNERGTFESDLTAHRMSRDHYRLFVGTGAVRRDMAWLRRRADGCDVVFEDCTAEWAVLALMGPEAARIVSEAGADELNGLGRFEICEARLAGEPVVAARISYVGEAGWEISCPAAGAAAVHAALVAGGACPAGLFAQTSMRIEKGFRAMGHELDGDITPVEAGLDFATRREGGFIGFESLEARRAAGAALGVVSLALDDAGAEPIGHEPVLLDGRIVGQTTSCAFGHRIGKPVALAHVREPVADGARVVVDIACEPFEATVAHGALFDPEGLRMAA